MYSRLPCDWILALVCAHDFIFFDSLLLCSSKEWYNFIQCNDFSLFAKWCVEKVYALQFHELDPIIQCLRSDATFLLLFQFCQRVCFYKLWCQVCSKSNICSSNYACAQQTKSHDVNYNFSSFVIISTTHDFFFFISVEFCLWHTKPIA